MLLWTTVYSSAVWIRSLYLQMLFFFFDLNRVCSDPFTILKTWAWCRWRWSERRGWWQLMLQVRKTLPHTHTVILTYDLSLCFPQLLIKPIISLWPVGGWWYCILFCANGSLASEITVSLKRIFFLVSLLWFPLILTFN